MIHKLLAGLCLAVFFFCIQPPWASAMDYHTEILADELEHPWSLAWLDDGRMLVTERAGRLRVLDPDGELMEEAVHGVPEAHVRSQAGLFEVLVDPDFAETRLLWLSMARGDGNANATTVYRARLEDHELRDVEKIFQAEPGRDTSAHYGGRMRFLPDETLLITLGDGFNFREDAQRLENHTGSIVRIHPDGSVPEDNPHVGDDKARPEIFSHGHRNSQGLVHDPETGRLWQHEHGPRGGDELNLLEAGKNYGWPVITQGVDYTGARVTPYREYPGMVGPVHVWTPAIAPSGMSLYRGDAFPEWDGHLLVSGLVGRTVRRLKLEGDEVVAEEALFESLDRRIRDVRTGPNGNIYLLTDHSDGELIRVSPAGE